jgi:hypothetical protein
LLRATNTIQVHGETQQYKYRNTNLNGELPIFSMLLNRIFMCCYYNYMKLKRKNQLIAVPGKGHPE